jgi:hypothetical protein
MFAGSLVPVSVFAAAGGADEFQGKSIQGFTRPDGTQLGTQAHCAWLQTCAPTSPYSAMP